MNKEEILERITKFSLGDIFKKDPELNLEGLAEVLAELSGEEEERKRCPNCGGKEFWSDGERETCRGCDNFLRKVVNK